MLSAQGDSGNWGGMTPRYITPDPALMYKAGPQFGVSGVNDDLVAATRQALKEMVEWLTLHQGFTPYEALVLCSAAADFKSESRLSLRCRALPAIALCCATAPGQASLSCLTRTLDGWLVSRGGGGHAEVCRHHAPAPRRRPVMCRYWS